MHRASVVLGMIIIVVVLPVAPEINIGVQYHPDFENNVGPHVRRGCIPTNVVVARSAYTVTLGETLSLLTLSHDTIAFGWKYSTRFF